nr:peroxidase 21 [Ipomoea batatas]
MATPIFKSIFLLSFLPFLLHIRCAKGDLQMGYYSKSCPRAEDIIKEQVIKLYEEHGNTAVSWLRNLFHDCMVKSCDASILLDSVAGVDCGIREEIAKKLWNEKFQVYSDHQSCPGGGMS